MEERLLLSRSAVLQGRKRGKRCNALHHLQRQRPNDRHHRRLGSVTNYEYDTKGRQTAVAALAQTVDGTSLRVRREFVFDTQGRLASETERAVLAAAPSDDNAKFPASTETITARENIPEWARTTNLRLRRPTLYPIELRGRAAVPSGMTPAILAGSPRVFQQTQIAAISGIAPQFQPVRTTSVENVPSSCNRINRYPGGKSSICNSRVWGRN